MTDILTDVKFEDKAFRFEVRDEKDLIQSARMILFLEGAGLMQEALQRAEKAYQYAITEKVALGIRLADLLRTTGGSLDRAFSLTENIPPSSLLASWGDSVRAAIVDAASVAGASQASP